MSKLLQAMILSLFIILVSAGIVWFFVVEPEEDPLDEMVKYSFESPEITTDLKDGTFVRIQFQIVTDGKKAMDEMSKRDFQLKNILIKEISQMTEEAFSTDLNAVESVIKEELNHLIIDGNVTDVYTIHKILQ